MDLDDIIDPLIQRFLQSTRLTFLSGVFGFIVTVCSFLAIPFAATLPNYNGAIVMCVITGCTFLVIFCFCSFTWFKLKYYLIVRHIYEPPPPPPRRTFSDSEAIGNEVELSDLAVGNASPTQMNDLSIAHTEINSAHVLSRDDKYNIFEDYTEETLSFIRPPIASNTNLMSRKESSNLESEVSNPIRSSSIDPDTHNKISAFNLTENPYAASTSEPGISKNKMLSTSDENTPCESETSSLSNVASIIKDNMPIYRKELDELLSDISPTIESETSEGKKDAPRMSRSFNVCEIKRTSFHTIEQELSGKRSNIKHSSPKKNTTGGYKEYFHPDIHDSNRSGKRAAAELGRTASTSKAEVLRGIRTSSFDEEQYSNRTLISSTKDVQNSSCSRIPSAAEADDSRNSQVLSDEEEEQKME
ncbi:hypothetical protein NPIL_293491 [Nephila pilipes]|uniref:Uncharacterized protein n=1 Tax=Nephila pilipes TaxID=299642 RepID=A0A8X6TR10_NEPPI|nr:hypothetical protein NPIL_293491 [Nephila pilipes]